jgi:hypothetical protein
MRHGEPVIFSGSRSPLRIFAAALAALAGRYSGRFWVIADIGQNAEMVAFDPKRTSAAQECCPATVTPDPHFASRKSPL